MSIHRRRADLPNLGQQFLDDDPQFADAADSSTDPRQELAGVDDDDAEPMVGLADDYGDDILLDNRNSDEGPLDTEFLIPAPGQAAGADEEAGGMYGSTADERLGSDNDDEIALGGGNLSTVMDDLHDESFRGQAIDVAVGHNSRPATGLEDQVAGDLPDGGTMGRPGPVIDPTTGELNDYDD